MDEFLEMLTNSEFMWFIDDFSFACEMRLSQLNQSNVNAAWR